MWPIYSWLRDFALAFFIYSGSVELAAVGVSIALFNQVSRIAIFPLVSVTTSFVAEEDAIGRVSAEETLECENLEAGSSVNVEHQQLIAENGKPFFRNSMSHIGKVLSTSPRPPIFLCNYLG